MNPTIDFYLLTEADPRARLAKTGRLIDEAYQQGRKIYIHTKSEAAAFELDESLWTFEDNSFIPHNLIREQEQLPPPVQIGFADDLPKSRDILINLSDSVLDYSHQFRRIIEIVPNDEQCKAQLREHFKQYRAQGYVIKTHSETATA